ncbi:hypothetical protein HZH66_009793 [Vespula vulgaris]|uniref:Uncharacterized protein n=1 Tax=Vespula vulgaris TaxID=7454 RepID=A0A834JMI2_VESVU|nr:hypothetical protein HZH66_009793 [Vespula vulgaris]
MSSNEEPLCDEIRPSPPYLSFLIRVGILRRTNEERGWPGIPGRFLADFGYSSRPVLFHWIQRNARPAVAIRPYSETAEVPVTASQDPVYT